MGMAPMGPRPPMGPPHMMPGPRPPMMQMGGPPAPPPPAPGSDEGPPAKKAKTEENLINEADFLKTHKVSSICQII